MLLQQGKVKMKLMKRYKNSLSRKLHQRLNNRQKLSIEKNFIKSEVEQNKVDLKLLKEAELKKFEGFFDEIKQEKPLDNIETFFIPDNDIFDSDDISAADWRFIMLTRNYAFNADPKSFLKIRRRCKWKFSITPQHKKWRKRNKCRSMMTIKGMEHALKIV